MAKRRRSVKSYRRVSRKRRARRGKRLSKSAFLARMANGRRKARKAPRRRKHAKRRARRTRAIPLLANGRRRANGKRRVSRRRRSNGKSLVSSIKNVFQVRTITRYAAIGGGIFGGTLLSRMLNTGTVPFTTAALPASITATLAKVRPFHGLIHILAGSLLIAKVKNKYAQDAGIGLAALGGFDLLMQLLAKAGMTNLPTFSGMNVSYAGRTMYNGGMTYPGALYGKRRMSGGMNVDLRSKAMAGYNVELMGEARARDAENSHLADNINDMLG